MRVLIVITGLGVGGAERLVTNLVDIYAAKGHEVMLASLSGPTLLRPANSQVRVVELRLVRRPLSLAFGLWRLRQLIREFRPEVVNSHMVHANILLRILRLVTPIPRLISSAHITSEDRLRMLAYRLTDRLTDISTNVSEEAVQAFVKARALRRGRMVSVLNGIDAKAFRFDGSARERLRKELQIDGPVPVLLAVGRLWEQKDYPNLLRALSHLQEVGQYPRLLVAGDGPLRPELEKLAAALGVASQVSFLGLREDVNALMSASEIFVLPSVREGLPVAVLEAMACERVVVATDCGGVRSLVGGYGFVTPVSNSDALAESLSDALTLSAEQRRELGKNARARVIKHYSISSMADELLSLYVSEAAEAIR